MQRNSQPDLSIACPPNTYARIAPRSGLAVKKFIDVGAGVVDADYRGPVGVVLFNFGEDDFHVKVGDRVAQLILERISMAETKEVSDLDETQRGEVGFGSTGVSADGLPVSKKARSISPSIELSEGIEESTQIFNLLSFMLEVNEICQAPDKLRLAIKKLALENL